MCVSVAKNYFTLKMENHILILIISFIVINFTCTECSRVEQFHPRYVARWETKLETMHNKSIVFTVDVETHGYVGFGLSPKGGMRNADIVVGGVYHNGTGYLRDAFGVGNQEPVFDDTCNWELIEAWENETHTHLEFSRLLDTCDKQDVVIQNDTNYIIWSIGETDEFKYHGTNRGSIAVNLLDPPLPPLDISKFNTWKMTNTMEMPNISTTYWCTIYKTPSLSAKHHIVGFRPVLPTKEALRHTHHFLVHECVSPGDEDGEQYFEPYLNANTSGHCYDKFQLSQYCTTYLFVWAVGGKIVLFPEHVGYPIAENGKPDYFMLEIHYDNPNKLSGVKFEAGIEFFYTPKIRKYDSGMLVVGHGLTLGLTIPPKMSDFVIAGHCSPDCTNKMPAEGINVFNVLLHSHLSGRKLKVRHFRNETELPWLANDDNYNFNYQQNRPLREEVRVLPGDQLTYECTYETRWKENVTIAGLGTNEEMCYSFLWYYPRMSLDGCRSSVSQESVLHEFGIQKLNWVDRNDPLVDEPVEMRNKSYMEVLNTLIDWTPTRIASFQKLQRYSKHHVVCNYKQVGGNKTRSYKISKDTSITYPENLQTYQPENTCRK